MESGGHVANGREECSGADGHQRSHGDAVSAAEAEQHYELWVETISA